MHPASTFIARNVREDIGSGLVAALLLASAVMLVYLATVGLPSDAADGVLAGSPAAQAPRVDAAQTRADAFADAPVYRLPAVTVVGHRDDAGDRVAGEHRPVAAQEAHAKRAMEPGA
jgi:hypothetical protein